MFENLVRSVTEMNYVVFLKSCYFSIWWLRSNPIWPDLCVSVFFCRHQGVCTDPHAALALPRDSKLGKEKAEDPLLQLPDSDEMTIRIGRAGPVTGKPPHPLHIPTSAVLCSISEAQMVLHGNLRIYTCNYWGHTIFFSFATIRKMDDFVLMETQRRHKEWLHWLRNLTWPSLMATYRSFYGAFLVSLFCL